jgi:hypothetical protein
MANGLAIEWDRPLQHRRGGKRRLGGLDIYYDFDWKEVFSHNRSVFPNGQSLAELVARECPDGKQPTLLLTTRDGVRAGIRQVNDRHIVIVPIKEYMAGAGGDAASTFYARLSGTPLTQLPSLSEAVFDEAELGRFLQQHLDLNRLREWAETNPDNRVILAQAVEVSIPQPRTVGDWLEEIRDLDHAGTLAVATSLTATAQGREATSKALSERLGDRIADARQQLSRYKDLITDGEVRETDVQRFLELNPWIVGLAYVRARPRVEIPRGEIDFILERYDGFFDVVELKGPKDVILIEGDGGDRPASASNYCLGPSLAKALAQAHLYRSVLERSNPLASEYGLADTRQPRVIILIGRATELTDTGREILRQLNLSLHRVEVLPYDVLGARSEGWLENIEELLRENVVADAGGAGPSELE